MSGDMDNAFLTARYETADRYGMLVKNARQWRLMAWLASVLLMASIGGLVWISMQSRIVPYIVQVDKHGFAITIAPAENTTVNDQKVIIATIGQFLQNVFTVVQDSTAQKRLIEGVYASIPEKSAALNTVNEYYTSNNPFTIANEKKGRLVEIISILPLGTDGNSWRAEWQITNTIKGAGEKPVAWTGIFQVAISPQKDVDSIVKNPLGIFISEINMSPNVK